jgi:AcrR family transcriptional regulator
MNETREKLLDEAEFLFGENGYSATSLRQIIAKAEVNLASIHYHFGSKQELLEQVILRKIGPINEKRVELLDHFAAEAAPDPASIEKIIEAFVLPAIMIDRDRRFLKFMARIHVEGLIPDIAQRHFQPMITRFASAFQRTCPNATKEELAWKIHFMIGAMAFTLLYPPESRQDLAPASQITIAKRLIAFISWGFRAPETVEKEVEVS